MTLGAIAIPHQLSTAAAMIFTAISQLQKREVGAMLFRQLFDQDTWTYTYLIADPNTKEAALVDPVIEKVERDFKLLNELGLTLKYSLETHVHADHITGTGKLRELTFCEGILPENAQVSCANRLIKDGEVLMLGAHESSSLSL